MKVFRLIIVVMAFVVFNPLRKSPDYSNVEVVPAKEEEPVVLAHELENSKPDSEAVWCTVYHAVEEQTNSDPGHTSTMFELDLDNPHKHKIIALSRDLLERFPYHSKVILEGTDYDGVYIVEDTMNERYTSRADVLVNLGMSLGSWPNAKITKYHE